MTPENLEIKTVLQILKPVDEVFEAIVDPDKISDFFVSKSEGWIEEGIKWILSNTEGWTNFLCCMKAYLEYGVNLRKGRYDYLIKNKQDEKI